MIADRVFYGVPSDGLTPGSYASVENLSSRSFEKWFALYSAVYDDLTGTYRAGDPHVTGRQAV